MKSGLAVAETSEMSARESSILPFQTACDNQHGDHHAEEFYELLEVRICNHHIYELKKGLRDLVLLTVPSRLKTAICSRIHKSGMEYCVRAVNRNKCNIFFGKKNCIEIVKNFGDQSLAALSPEQDFILGIMLGYARSGQYERYLRQC